MILFTLFPLHTHQHHCKLLVCAVVWKYRCTHRPEVVNISCFLTGTTRIKLSVDEFPSPAMGRSTFPHATALDRRSHRSFSESVSASQPEWRVSFPFPALWKGIFMVPRTMPDSWQVVPGEKLCTRLALSPARSCWFLIAQDLSGFSMSSETSASKYLQPVALAPCSLEDAHSWKAFHLVLLLEVTAAQIAFSRATLYTLWWCPKPYFFQFCPFLTVQSLFC